MTTEKLSKLPKGHLPWWAGQPLEYSWPSRTDRIRESAEKRQRAFQEDRQVLAKAGEGATPSVHSGFEAGTRRGQTREGGGGSVWWPLAPRTQPPLTTPRVMPTCAGWRGILPFELHTVRASGQMSWGVGTAGNHCAKEKTTFLLHSRS